MVDKDGEFKYSGIITVVVNKQEHNLYVYPNPAKTSITLVCKSFSQTTQVSIINNLGVAVTKIKLPAGTTRAQIDVHALSPGWYTLRSVNNDKVEIFNFLKE